MCEKNNSDVQLHIRMTKDEKERLNEMSRQEGVTISTYIKKNVLDQNGNGFYTKQSKDALEKLTKVVDAIDSSSPYYDDLRKALCELWLSLNK